MAVPGFGSVGYTGAMSEHLIEGGIYSVLAQEDGRGDYLLAKVIEAGKAKDIARVDPGSDETGPVGEAAGGVVHVVILAPSFKKRPGLNDIKDVPLGLTDDLSEARSRHLALSRKLFCLMRPVLLERAALTEGDLAGLRKWKMLEPKEVIEAPELIESEDNSGVWWRIFLVTGLPFGLLQGLFNYFRFGLNLAILGFVAGALCFGGAMVALQYLSVHRRLKLGFVRLPARTLTAFQVREVVVPGDFAGVFGKARAALGAVKNIKLEIDDYSGGTIEGFVKAGLLEGEKISINAYKVDSASTGVVITSVPRGGGEVDLGRNFSHVAGIVEYLKKSCHD